MENFELVQMIVETSRASIPQHWLGKKQCESAVLDRQLFHDDGSCGPYTRSAIAPHFKMHLTSPLPPCSPHVFLVPLTPDM